jgi:GH25 family lysozyme M1 (1,4-beta-N-acetylmuramidase)
MNEAEAKREAECCLALLKGKQFEFPIYYDVEEYDLFKSGKTAEVCRAFIKVLEDAGYWVGIYTYRSAMGYFPADIKDKKAMAIAEYGSKLNYSGQYGIWQNSSTWYVKGINGRVDHDYCYVDYPKLIKERGKNGFPAATSDIKVETASDTDVLWGTTDAPPVAAVAGKGTVYTIDKTTKIGGYTFGRIKGTSNWINIKTCKRI